jgi:uncharacterized protein (TIGR02996 family)
MTDYDALLRAIVARPHEIAPRLIFADYLDENSFDPLIAKACRYSESFILENVHPPFFADRMDHAVSHFYSRSLYVRTFAVKKTPRPKGIVNRVKKNLNETIGMRFNDFFSITVLNGFADGLRCPIKFWSDRWHRFYWDGKGDFYVGMQPLRFVEFLDVIDPHDPQANYLIKRCPKIQFFRRSTESRSGMLAGSYSVPFSDTSSRDERNEQKNRNYEPDEIVRATAAIENLAGSAFRSADFSRVDDID